MTKTHLAPTSAAAVANFFLDIEGKETNNTPPIDQLKIQKLSFYSHAWWLAYDRGPLFDEDIEAWPWGPVVRELYGQFIHCGRNPIGNRRATTLVKVGDGPQDYRVQIPVSPSNDIKAFLESVWDTHKHMSGIALSNATHMAGEPWTIVKEQRGGLDEKPTIPNDLIRDVFKQKIIAKA